MSATFQCLHMLDIKIFEVITNNKAFTLSFHPSFSIQWSSRHDSCSLALRAVQSMMIHSSISGNSLLDHRGSLPFLRSCNLLRKPSYPMWNCEIQDFIASLAEGQGRYIFLRYHLMWLSPICSALR